MPHPVVIVTNPPPNILHETEGEDERMLIEMPAPTKVVRLVIFMPTGILTIRPHFPMFVNEGEGFGLTVEGTGLIHTDADGGVVAIESMTLDFKEYAGSDSTDDIPF